MVRRHGRLEVRARLPRIPALWRAAAEQLVTREEALLAFARFEAKVSAPERLLDRRRSGHLGRETARRAVLRERLVEADAKITATMGRLERVGDSLAFHGELYRRKMRTDEGQLRQIFLRQQRLVAAEVDEVEVDDVFAPPGRPAALTPRAAEKADRAEIDEAYLVPFHPEDVAGMRVAMKLSIEKDHP